MKYISIILFIFIAFEINLHAGISYYTIDEIMLKFNRLKLEESKLKIIIDCLCSTFNDAYAFNEVAKNPPQPSFDNNYHPKVNIQESLKSINLKDISLYKYYQQIKLIFDKLGDQHLTIDISGFSIKSCYFTSPIKLIVKEYNNKPRIFAQIKVDETEYKYFRNHETVFNITKQNYDIPIKTINGKDPFNYITNFGGDYERLKSPQGCFTYKYFLYNDKLEFFDFPLEKEDLTNFNVVYENGDNFTTDYIAYSDGYFNIEKFNEEIKLLVDNYIINKDKNNKLNKTDIFKDILIFRNQKLYRKLFRNENDESEKIKMESQISKSKWDYNYKYAIACREDNDYKINIFGLMSFAVDTSNDYIETIQKCMELFDQNTYPIILVNILNGGGLVTNSQFLLEALSPNLELNIYGRMRKTNIIKKSQIIEQFLNILSDVDDCEPFSYSSFMRTEKEVNYGNSVSDTLLGPFIFNGRLFREQLNNFKAILKNKRKPTEILLYTDGFSYSATSLLLKYLQYYGGGITVGYFPNPNLNNTPYDSSLSPSSIFTPDALEYLEPEGYETLSSEYHYSITMAGTQTFYTPNEYEKPLEYEVTPVDEIANIYPNIQIYKKESIMEASTFDIFINESLKIIEKYKTQCNPNNKKLLLITSECDASFSEHTHGGYECGSDGLWTKNCVASYCDIGYIFDHEKKKCIDSVCKPEDVVMKFIIIIIIIISLIILLIVIYCICVKIQKRNKEKRMALNSVDNMNLNEPINQNEKKNS